MKTICIFLNSNAERLDETSPVGTYPHLVHTTFTYQPNDDKTHGGASAIVRAGKKMDIYPVTQDVYKAAPPSHAHPIHTPVS